MRDRPMRAAALATVAAAALSAGCAGPSTSGNDRGVSAAATLSPTAGNGVAGNVRFVQRGARTLVEARITGLAPNAEHGFHVHERGDCSSADGSSAGGHFNPKNQPHGFHAEGTRHAGDLPNVRADAQGVATLRWESDLLGVTEGPTSVLGRSVVVHRDPDDYRSQPAGNSGPRMGCGVVRAG